MTSTKSFTSMFANWTAHAFVVVLVVSLAAAQLSSQDKRPYQAGTIVDVKPHPADTAGGDAAKAKDVETQKYDISIRIGARIYVVLYTPPIGQNYPELGLGMDRTVLVDGDTMKVNDLLGRTRSMPILSSKDAPPKATN
jgi:hypothetical protein